MDSGSFGKLEVNCDGFNDLGNGKWADKPGCKFTSLHSDDGQVLCEEPHSFTNLVVGLTIYGWPYESMWLKFLVTPF